MASGQQTLTSWLRAPKVHGKTEKEKPRLKLYRLLWSSTGSYTVPLSPHSAYKGQIIFKGKGTAHPFVIGMAAKFWNKMACGHFENTICQICDRKTQLGGSDCDHTKPNAPAGSVGQGRGWGKLRDKSI